jgi:hypothetical protein
MGAHHTKKGMEILVFKTNVNSKRKAGQAGLLLTSVPAIEQWNFDLDDCDKVLRIVGKGLRPGYVESILQKAGFYCTELDYYIKSIN